MIRRMLAAISMAALMLVAVPGLAHAAPATCPELEGIDEIEDLIYELTGFKVC